MTAVHAIVPESIDDPARPSGGNVYDRQVCRGLAALGWTVHEHAMPGDWPLPGAVGHRALARAVHWIPDGAVVLLDGLMSIAHAPVVLVSAPAGYGKSTLLALWREHDERPFAWVSLDATDNDPAALVAGGAGRA